jgi:uncharacterized protein YndB with AHSA1/START domain
MAETTTNPARELTITREVDAPRDLVWRAWTDPDLLARWWGPKGMTAQRQSIHIAARAGGPFRLTMVSDADGTQVAANGSLREVAPPERLVYVEPPGRTDADAIQVARVMFTQVGEQRTRVVVQTRLRLPESMLPGAQSGWASALDKLADALAAHRAREAAGPPTGQAAAAPPPSPSPGEGQRPSPAPQQPASGQQQPQQPSPAPQQPAPGQTPPSPGQQPPPAQPGG